MSSSSLSQNRWQVPLLLTVHTLERLGFWGLRSLLVLFLIEPFAAGGLGWSESSATVWVGYYSAGLYVTPLLGGVIADRWLGGRKSVVMGLAMMAIGIGVLMWPHESLLYVSLLFLALGNGFFKPCLTAMLGQLYDEKDPARERAYQYLYQTVLIGVLGAFYFGGLFHTHFGFSIAFGLFACCSLLAMLLFLAAPKKTWPDHTVEKKIGGEEQKPLWPIARLALITIFFFAAHSQGGGLMTVFIHRYMEHTLFGWELHTLWLNSLGTIFGIALTPVLAVLWTRLGSRGQEPTYLRKLSLGIAATACAFLFMVAASMHRTSSGAELASGYWLLGYHVAYIMGKLLVTPVLWSNAERLAPAHLRYRVLGVMMGCISIGYILGGQVGHFIGHYSFETIFTSISATCLLMMLLLWNLREESLHVEPAL